jgi:DNA-directed RNA polymerase specialized sigma24 family protein
VQPDGLRACDPETVRHLLALLEGWLSRVQRDLRARDVNDVAESALAEAWGRIAAASPEALAATPPGAPSLEAWVLSIARRRLLDLLASQNRSPEQLDAGSSPGWTDLQAEVEAQALRQMVLEEAVSGLSEEEQGFLRDTRVGELSLEQIALRDGRPIRELALLEYRALRALGDACAEFASEFRLEVKRSDSVETPS